MNDTARISIQATPMTVSELRQLPPTERAAILELQATFAEGLYQSGSDLLDFEAFREELTDGDAPPAQEG